MNFAQQISNIFRGGRKFFHGSWYTVMGGWDAITKHAYADGIYYSMVKLLADLNHDVTWQFDNSNLAVESAFVRFYNQYCSMITHRLFEGDGVVVIAHTQVGEGATAAHEFHIALRDEFSKIDEDGWTVYKSAKVGVDIYAMMSPTKKATGRGDKQIASPMLELLDNTLNASNTVSSRLGAMVVCSPKTPNSSPMPISFDEEEKKEIEEQISKEYGALSKQKQVMVLPKEMSWQVVSLATLDLKTMDKVKMAVCALADQIGVPANQSALIDANSSKSLSNGSELLAGDFAKYQSFERLLDCTWVQMARDLNLAPGMIEAVQGEPVKSYYTIYNKPQRNG